MRYTAWLNPMPNESWQHTTAGEIKRFVPMFEMSREGINGAISLLRGQYVAWREIDIIKFSQNNNVLQTRDE
ncbi:MAG: hypothetical protein ACM37W_27900 [Actinomycetota bacterium]